MAEPAEIDVLLELYSMRREKVDGMLGEYWLVYRKSDPDTVVHAWDFNEPIEQYAAALERGEFSITRPENGERY